MTRPARKFPTRSIRVSSVYIAVLAVALIVSIIGLSALLGMRVEQRSAALNEASIRAGFYAPTVIDLALLTLTATPDWRGVYANDTWTTAQTVSDLTYSFKLVDELDADLTNDPTQPARLYARANVGEATRIDSVLLQPRGGFNLLTNGDAESGTSNWWSLSCALTSKSDTPHGGGKYLQVSSRLARWACVGQDITSDVKNGGTYQLVAWVRMKSGSDSVIPIIYTNDSVYGQRTINGVATTVGTTWTKITSSFVVTWSGTLSEADYGLDPSSTTTDYSIDDVMWVELTDQAPLYPVPGTWRQEVTMAAMPDPNAALPMPGAQPGPSPVP